jgi:hypothetical protein
MGKVTSHLDFIILNTFIFVINSNETQEHKIKILREYSKYPFIKKVLYYTYNPKIKFNLIINDIKFKDTKINNKDKYVSLFLLLEDLSNNKCGNTHIIDFIQSYSIFKKVIVNILNQDLKINVTNELLETALPKLFKLSTA